MAKDKTNETTTIIDATTTEDTIIKDTQVEDTTIEETTTESFDVDELLDNPKFQQVMNSYADKRVSEAQKKLDAKYKKQLADETKKLNMSQEEILAEKEQLLLQRELKLDTVGYFKEKGYSLDMMDFVSGSNIEEVKEKSDVLMNKFNETVAQMVASQVEERLKGSHKPINNDKTTSLSINDMGGMSVDEINKHWNQLKK